MKPWKTDAAPALDPAITDFLTRSGLIAAGQVAHFEPLPGGVSSDIWIVKAGEKTTFCLKKALPQLRVDAEWLAPVTRNAAEVSWLKAVARFMPDAVPKVLAADAELGMFAMEYLSPLSYEPWKTRLRRGDASPETGAVVGRRLALMHAAFSRLENADTEFANEATFYALRLEPYLVATAIAHPDLAPVLDRLRGITAKTKLTVVHGDVSPKNILLGPKGPVFVDAECAWYGDPAFDLAFCLNHLLLKTLWVPAAQPNLLRTFTTLSRAYLEGVDWESPAALETRAAHLLPALLLARVDGKSPVEYLTDDASKNTVRRVARVLLTEPVDLLSDVLAAWMKRDAKPPAAVSAVSKVNVDAAPVQAAPAPAVNVLPRVAELAPVELPPAKPATALADAAPKKAAPVEAAQTVPSEVAPFELTPVDAAQLERAPEEPELSEAAQLELMPSDAAQLELAPIEAAPAEVGATVDAPAEAAPVEAAPAEITPAEFAIVEAAPAAPAPVARAPVEPAPVELAPVEPARVEPAPVETPTVEAPTVETASGTPAHVDANVDLFRRTAPVAAAGPHIERVIGRRVWDSRGRPTVEAEIFLDNGASGRAIAPVGASTGRHEAIDLRDGGKAHGGLGVARAVGNITTEIAAALRGMPVADQAAIDRRLIELDGTPNKGRLGANATVAVSMAALHAAAAAEREPLWRYVLATGNAGGKPMLPMPMVQIFGGGAHAGFRLDVQDFLIIPIGASTFNDAMSMTASVYDAAGRIMRDRGRLQGVADEGGWWPAFASNTEALDTLVEAIERAELKPGTDVGIAIDVAASQLRRGLTYYLKAEGVDFERERFIELLVGWCGRYPIVSIEDPLSEDDDEGMRSFTAKMGERLQIVGDDYLVTSAERIAKAASLGACNAALIKPNQVGTITETLAAIAAARTAGWSAIISARSGESEDVTIAHLAVGWGVGQLKVGSFARSERTAKWNEVLRIEEALGSSAIFHRGLPNRRSTMDDGRSTMDDGR